MLYAEESLVIWLSIEERFLASLGMIVLSSLSNSVRGIISGTIRGSASRRKKFRFMERADKPAAVLFGQHHDHQAFARRNLRSVRSLCSGNHGVGIDRCQFRSEKADALHG